jgi:hypothetical protein
MSSSLIATALKTPADPRFDAVAAARHHDPLGVLGLHREGSAWTVRAFRPYAAEVAVRPASCR